MALIVHQCVSGTRSRIGCGHVDLANKQHHAEAAQPDLPVQYVTRAQLQCHWHVGNKFNSAGSSESSRHFVTVTGSTKLDLEPRCCSRLLALLHSHTVGG